MYFLIKNARFSLEMSYLCIMVQDEELIKAAEDYAKGVVEASIEELKAKYGAEYTAGEDCVPLVMRYFLAGAEWQRNRNLETKI